MHSPEAEIAEKLKKRLQTFGAPAALLQTETLQTGNMEISDNQFMSHSPTQLENHDYTLLRNILNLKWQLCIWHQGFLDLSSRPDRLHIGVYLHKCSEMGSIHSGKNRPGLMFPFLSLKAVMKAVASHRKS